MAPRLLGAQSVAVAGGLAIPHGAVNGRAPDVGGHVQLSLEFGRPTRTLGFRLDALYSQLPGAPVTVTGFGVVGQFPTERTFALTGAAVLRSPAFGPGGLRPYVLAGAGLYGQNTITGFSLGVNGGVGLAMPVGGLQLFAEARVHRFWQDARVADYGDRGITLVPLSFGLRF